MTNAFAKSRYIAWIGGSVAGIAAAAAAWLYMAQRPAGGFNRLLVAGLAAFVAVNLLLYAARIVAEKEYQKRLLLLYEKLDPQAFLEAVLPLKGKRLNASGRCTLLVHIANGYLYSGEPLRALEILDGIQPPDTALEMRGLVAGNRATCLLAAGETDRARRRWTSCCVLREPQSAGRNLRQKRAAPRVTCKSASALPAENMSIWRPCIRISSTAVHRCTSWTCSTALRFRTGTGATVSACGRPVIT